VGVGRLSADEKKTQHKQMRSVVLIKRLLRYPVTLYTSLVTQFVGKRETEIRLEE